MTAENELVHFVLDRLTEKSVIPEQYEDLQGAVQEVPLASRLRMVEALGFLRLLNPALAETWPEPSLQVLPGARCYMPASLQPKGCWGVAAQIYELRSSRNWGIGDLEDVRTLCTIAADAGADFIGLNPLHALFLSDPERCSPYSPSNRRFLNPLYLAVDKVAGFRDDLVDQQRLTELRATELVDYTAVAEIKLQVLKTLWRKWRNGDARKAAVDQRAFEEFKAEGGSSLFGHCLFESLSCEMPSRGYGSGWLNWPEEFRSRSSTAVEDFIAGHSDDIDFHIWLQWLTSIQLEEVSAHARSAGMCIGLYLDFAVGEVPDGSSTWSEPDMVLSGMQIGAPPDAFSARGQDWGLVPLSPASLLDRSLSYFRELIDCTARYAGALRLDHAMSLWQLFLIPAGEAPAAGGYLRYPFTGSMSDLAEISHHRKMIVVGEDLGNVPAGFRPALQKAGVFGYKVIYFEDFSPTDSEITGSASLACLSTHDLPPLIGWWSGDDIAFAEMNGWCDSATATNLHAEREGRRRGMFGMLAEAGLMQPTANTLTQDPAIAEDLVVGLHTLLARTDSLLVALRLADMVGERRSTNIPGTSEEYPNWRLKLDVPLEELKEMRLFRNIAKAQREERPRKPG
ncbi:4-alpha-glucanotransferase [Rhizobium terrae]|uniref:4-alpha-glucanotransferase n=1 Tax=Rhizobium terrae TaxID=2171756 RepID=UPI0013C2D6FF|nr:4-alpha-glucanotransferase [Rhizobium terrae]